MWLVISFLLIISGSAYAQVPGCTADGSLTSHNEHLIKMFALHYKDRTIPLADIKAKADSITVTYTKPACDANSHPLPWDQLHVTIVPQ